MMGINRWGLVIIGSVLGQHGEIWVGDGGRNGIGGGHEWDQGHRYTKERMKKEWDARNVQ